jgi:hypothetical protein
MGIKNERQFVLCSAVVFIILNALENYIHYNIGRNHDMLQNELKVPNQNDLVQMGITMLIFAFLQSFGTFYLYNGN